MAEVALALESPLWEPLAAWEPLVSRVLEAALAHARRRAVARAPDGIAGEGPVAVEISVLLTDDPGMRVLNARWRGKDRPTNVLAFPLLPPEEAQRALLDVGAVPPLLGDVVLAHETIAREASALGLAFADHLAHLLVHGCLHLLGYDHDREEEAEAMEEMESVILGGLGIACPDRSPHGAALGRAGRPLAGAARLPLPAARASEAPAARPDAPIANAPAVAGGAGAGRFELGVGPAGGRR